MRVLHVTTEFPPLIYGGLGTAVGGLAAASAANGITVAVLLVGGGSSGYEQAAVDAHAVRGPTRIRAGAITRFEASHSDALSIGLEIIRGWRPDVIHLHTFWLWPLARDLRARTGVPLVYTVHSLDRAEYDVGYGPPECMTQWDVQSDLIASSDRVIALTRSERDLIGEYCPTSHCRVRVVGNGIDDSAGARAAARRERTARPPIVLFTGRFVERKGIGDLLKAIPIVLRDVNDARFVLAGGHRGSTGDEVARYWAPGLANRIQFTGWLSADEMSAWYAAADVLVVPSWYEPFGMVVLEGMLHGLAIAAASVGGPAEILEDGRTGLLFPARDPDALASSLVRLLTNPALRRELGSAAAAEVRETWAYARIVRDVRSVYEEAVSCAAGGAAAAR